MTADRKEKNNLDHRWIMSLLKTLLITKYLFLKIGPSVFLNIYWWISRGQTSFLIGCEEIWNGTLFISWVICSLQLQTNTLFFEPLKLRTVVLSYFSSFLFQLSSITAGLTMRVPVPKCRTLATAPKKCINHPRFPMKQQQIKKAEHIKTDGIQQANSLLIVWPQVRN